MWFCSSARTLCRSILFCELASLAVVWTQLCSSTNGFAWYYLLKSMCATINDFSKLFDHTSNVTAITEVRSASFRLVLHAQHIFANSFNFVVTWGLPVTVFHSTCTYCAYSMVLYWPTLQFYVCVYISFVCRYVVPPNDCYYNTITWQLFCIVECGIAYFLCTRSVFKVQASFSSPRLPLCQILFLSQPPLLS